MNTALVSNVSDTARWVATYRAWETARPEALFRDPLAARLAGEHGQAIAAMMPRQARSGWPLIVRTKLIDDLVMNAIAERCDCVINLAAGLDTRPYRMQLPPALRWIEADLPAMVEEKEQVLATEKPACRLSRYRVDLSDPEARAAFLDESLYGATRALVISEGLLIYLNEVVVRTLAIDLAARAAAQWWVVDLASPKLLQLIRRSMGVQLTNAPMIFAPENGVAFFEPLGWAPQDIRPLLSEAARLRRLPWFLHWLCWLPQTDPRQLGHARWSAVVRFARAA
jgi:methyltransferase (TIGR00027 family)